MEITTFEFAPVGVSPPSDGMYLRRRGAASVPAASGLLGAPLVHIPCTPPTYPLPFPKSHSLRSRWLGSEMPES